VKPPDPFVARPATLEDAAGVAALMNAFDRAFLEEPDEMDATEVAGWWTGADLERDTLVVRHPVGKLAASGRLKEEGEAVLELDAYVHPESLGCGLGGFLLDWAEEESSRRDRRTLRTAALAADPAAKLLIEGRGFVPVRHFYRMLIDLDSKPAEAVWSEGIEVATFATGDEATLHAVIEEAFADHWGHEPRDLEHWHEHVFSQAWWDPSLVYLVREGDEVAAAEINAFRFGMGWVGTLGTRVPWRGRGLGRALLLTAFGEFHRRGQERIGLAVDAGNETGATHLYESVGMRVSAQADIYEKQCHFQ
jgi:GNAT superfamily N-acetyltransferase